MSTAMDLPDQLVYLIIRFTTSTPDLPLAVHSPRTTTTLSLKQLIRPHLPFSHASSRLRLIYAGKVLADTTPLSTSLRIRLPPPPPPRDGPPPDSAPSSAAKGKQPVRDVSPIADAAAIPAEAKRYYIHCSLGDALSPADLASEATLAQTTETSLKSQYQTQSQGRRASHASATAEEHGAHRGSSSGATTVPAPQGFDRLLSSGFTAQEVAALRSQFQTNLSLTHTPDTMPSAAEMRVMEDRWLDSTAADPSGAMGADGGDGGWGPGFGVEEGGLDDMLWGHITGFFWPLGALVMGFREDGLWAWRRQWAVIIGLAVNAAFGFMRWSQ